MRAIVLKTPGTPLSFEEVPCPIPREHEVLIKVSACAVCRTDLHVVDGELVDPKWPLIPGHEIVGTVVEVGSRATRFKIGDRVGVPWLGWTCGECSFCLRGEENLCDQARFTGYTLNGGYAEFAVAHEAYIFKIPERLTDAEAAPLLCAGLIGYRAYRMAGDARRIGLYGFGAAAHILTQLAKAEGREVYAFTRPGDGEAQKFALELGAIWVGSSDEPPPRPLDAALIFAPVGALVPTALKAVRKGGTVVCGGIHMSDIPSFPYEALWGERVLRSVANLARRDGEEFFQIISQIPIRTETALYPLGKANQALQDLRRGCVRGAAVLVNF